MADSIDFSVNNVDLGEVKMDEANVQMGCFGDGGSDYANVC